MRPPRPRELAIARELAEIVILDTALHVVCDVLVDEHPAIEEPASGDPPSLYAARSVLSAAQILRRKLREYRETVLAWTHDEDESLPF